MTESVPWTLPFGFLEWMPAKQAATLGALTFVQEDVPTVTAALMAAAGNLTWTAAFWGCFLGIWIGDVLLYLIARVFGRRVLQHQLARHFFDAAAIDRSEHWFDSKGAWLLVSSRFVPGSRLPTYLAAGFLRLNAAKFLTITGTTVVFWTILIFAIARMSGPKLITILKAVNNGVFAFAAAIGLILGLIAFVRSFSSMRNRQKARALISRCTQWEFWPAWLFYVPVVMNYIWLSIRYRGFTVPTAANPGIFTGGIVGESKISILEELQRTSPEFVAAAHLVKSKSDLPNAYPCVLKPDVGQRGVGVKLIRSREDALHYLDSSSAPLICQEYAQGPFEIGVFYYRFPGVPKGKIFAITEKIFPYLIGDGERSVEELIWADKRARCVARIYLRRLAARQDYVPSSGERIKLVEAGNHAQGCIFQDGMHMCSPALEERIDDISKKLNGYFIGRYDIRFANQEDLKRGRNFQIIELNGAASEATSIYDTRNSLFSAYRMLFRQWKLVFAIGAENRRLGSSLTTVGVLWQAWRRSGQMIASYPVAD